MNGPSSGGSGTVAALLTVCVLVWGTTWYAIVWQLEAIAPAPGVAVRFALAAAGLFAWALWQGQSLRFPWAVQRLLAIQGLLSFTVSYLCVYHAERYIVSGLVAVGYAATPLINMVLARWLMGTPLSRPVGVGGVAGLVGVVLIFWHEFARLSEAPHVLLGAGLTVAAVLTSSLSNMAVAFSHRQGVSGPAPLAWAMAWGAAGTALVALVQGDAWTPRWSWAFVGSMAWLVLGGSIIAFACFYALMRRVGPAKAGYVGVTTPVVALLVSSVFEGFHWQWATVAGVALAVGGNVWALWPRPAAGEGGAGKAA